MRKHDSNGREIMDSKPIVIKLPDKRQYQDDILEIVRREIARHVHKLAGEQYESPEEADDLDVDDESDELPYTTRYTDMVEDDMPGRAQVRPAQDAQPRANAVADNSADRGDDNVKPDTKATNP